MRHAQRAYSSIAWRRAAGLGHFDSSMPNAVSLRHDQ
jgi:hypothetical protein